MELHITSAEEKRVLQVAWLEIDTPAGNFVIHKGHAPMLVTLVPGKTILMRLKSGKQENIAASGGIVHITRTSVTIILSDYV
jgi:F0F1-type ATP synthase epsilon subunit